MSTTPIITAQRGEPGVDGADGLDSTVPGPEGPQGPAGEGITLIGNRTVAEMNLDDGTTNAPGDSWSMLDSGTITTGTVPIDVVIGDLVAWSESGEWVNQGQSQGPQGEQGDQGAPGDDGQDGAQGVQGDDGVDGTPGEDGLPGPLVVSADAGNTTIISGIDGFIYTPVTPVALLGDIGDVDVALAGDGQRLAFDELNQVWVPRTSTSSLGIVALNYKWDTDLNPVQAAGRVSSNHLDATLVTQLFIASRGDGGGGVDYSVFFDSLEEGDWINLADRTDATQKNSYDVIGPAVLTADTWAIPVVFYESSGYVPADGSQMAVFMRFGQGTGDVVPEAPADGTPYSRQDNSWVPASTGGGGATEFDITQVAHTHALMDILRYDGAAWVKAMANDPATMAVAVVVAVTDVDNFTAAISGRYSAPAHGLDLASFNYLSETVPGGTQPTAPVNEQPIIFAEDNDWFIILPYRPSVGSGAGGPVLGVGVDTIEVLTQAEYDLLAPPLGTTLYFIT
jgi:hypothetical protein